MKTQIWAVLFLAGAGLLPAAPLPADYAEQVEAAYQAVFEKEEKGGWKGLTEKEKVVALLQIFEAEIFNGGLEQFYGNSSGQRTAETLAALEKVGDFETAGELRKTFVAFKDGIPPREGDKRENVQLETTPQLSRVYEWFNDYLGTMGNLRQHLYWYWKEGKAVTAADLRRDNPELYKMEPKFKEIEAKGPAPAFAAYLKIYEDSSMKPLESIGQNDFYPADVEWRIKWSKAFDSGQVGDLIDKHLKLRDGAKDEETRNRHDFFCTALFSLVEFQPALDAAMEKRLLKWEKEGLKAADINNTRSETFGPAGALHKHWPDKYPQLDWDDEGKALKNAEAYRKAIESQGL